MQRGREALFALARGSGDAQRRAAGRRQWEASRERDEDDVGEGEGEGDGEDEIGEVVEDLPLPFSPLRPRRGPSALLSSLVLLLALFLASHLLPHYPDRDAPGAGGEGRGLGGDW